MALGAVALAVGRGWIGGSGEPAATPVEAAPVRVETRSVLIARRDIVQGEELLVADVATRAWPRDLAPSGAFDGVDDLVGPKGETAFAKGFLAAGEPITPLKVAYEPPRRLLAQDITPGMRAVSFKVDDVTGVAGFVLPGDRVDIVEFSGKPDPDANPRDPTPRMIGEARPFLSDVLVLGVDQAFGGGHEGARPASTVTVELSPKDSLKLRKAALGGALSLMLIGAREDEAPAPEPVQIIAEPVKPKPRPRARFVPAAPRRPSTAQIRVIQGASESTVQTPTAKGGAQ